MKEFFMFFFNILKEWTLNLLLALSLFCLCIILNNKLDETMYEILKNISYSIIASIIFYYINVIYTNSKNDKKIRNYLIEEYKLVQSIQLNSIYICLPYTHQSVLPRNNLNNPEFFSHYFISNNKGLPNWYKFIVDNMDEENKKLVIDQMIDFKNLLTQNIHSLSLTSKSRIHLNSYIRSVERLQSGNHEDFYSLLLSCGCAFSVTTGKGYECDPQLYFLNSLNYTFKKWRYIKCYAITTYIWFWTVFSYYTFIA